MNITAVAPSEKAGFVDVFIDGAFLASVERSFAEDNGLEEGLAISPELCRQLSDLHARSCAMGFALRKLAFSPKTRSEIVSALKREGFPPHLAESVADELEQKGYINDASLAKSLAERLSRSKFYSPVRIEAELRRRGIPRELAREAASALQISERESIMAFLEKAFARDRTRKSAAKAERRLASLGYGRAAIRAAVRDFFKDVESEEDYGL